MAQSSPGFTGEHGRLPASLSIKVWSAHRIHPSEDRVQASLADAVLDRLRGEPEVQQLLSGDHLVLTMGQLPGTPLSSLRDLVPHRGPRFGEERTLPLPRPGLT